MTWKIAFQTEIRGFEPETSSSKKLKRKKELKKALSAKIGKQYENILKRVIGRELFIDVIFYLY